MTNKGLLIAIVVILLGILGVVFVESNDQSPLENLSDNVSEFDEEVGDEIDDATTN